ncbi:MAG: transposase [Verrucomicrobiota bacterium]
MPRAPRIEYEGAVYHVMARGNRREPIVFDDEDRRLFVTTLGEACGMTGWRVFAWVLMDNHYHLVFRTPQANLVDGMKWFQNAYTRRLNSRHKLWGHLFGGRYRSILVENSDHGGAVWRDYLRTVIDYAHLNPGRAGLVDGTEKEAKDYPWSSLGSAFCLPPSKRPDWMAVEEVLDLFQMKDTAKGRHEFAERINTWVREEKGEPSMEGVSVQQRARRGWFWGSEPFKESMLALLEGGDRSQGKTRSGQNRTYQSSELIKDHGEKRAGEILLAALNHFRLNREELKRTIRGDFTRAAIASRLFRETTMSQDWIAEQLGMKSAANVCQQIRKYSMVPTRDLPVKLRKWDKLNIF